MSGPVTPTDPAKSRHPHGRVVWGLFGLAALVNGVAWALILWKLPPTDGTVFLHYNIYFGIDLAGSWYQLLWIPGSGTVIVGVNLIVTLLATGLQKFFRVIGAVVTLLIELMILLASLLVVLLNG
jgi:hypothetical protein